MSAVRAFLSFAAEEQGNSPQLPRTRAPKRPRTLPRPASPADAIALAEEAASRGAATTWIGARDLAILLLLYGAGLRVAEALSLTARVLPLGPGAAGHRQARQDARSCRSCRRCARRSTLMSRYARVRWRATCRCSSAPRAGRSIPTSCAARCAARGRGSACPTA